VPGAPTPLKIGRHRRGMLPRNVSRLVILVALGLIFVGGRLGAGRFRCPG
jgi:hypothetical protein